MNKRTLGALLVFLLLLGVVYYLQTRPEKGERRGPRATVLPKLSAQTIRQVTISAKGTTVVLERTGPEKWTLTRPLRYPADDYATRSMIEQLEKLEIGDLVTEVKARHAEHQVDDKSGVRVVVSDGKKTLADFYVGKAVESFTLLRVAGQDQVYQAVGSLGPTFEREVKNWRNRTIVEFKQEDARRLEVVTAEGTIALTRADEKGAWTVERSTAPVDKLDLTTAANLLSTLSSLSAFDFADGAKPEQTGLGKPTATASAKLKDGSARVVLLGRSEGESHWVQRQGDDQVFVIQKYAAEHLSRRPIDFRDKTLLSFKAEDVVSIGVTKIEGKTRTQVALTRQGEEWLGDGKKVKDAARIKGAIEALADLKAEGFARQTAQELGLVPPAWILEIALKDRTRHQIALGSVERDGLFGVSRKGLPDVFALRKHVLERLQLDPKDYK